MSMCRYESINVSLLSRTSLIDIPGIIDHLLGIFGVATSVQDINMFVNRVICRPWGLLL